MLNLNRSSKLLNSHRYQPKTAADVLQHLPLHRNLSDSQSALVAIAPIWQRWLAAAISQNKITQRSSQSIRLEAWRPARQPELKTKPTQSQSRQHVAGSLIVSCDNSAVATQLKHLRESIVEYLNTEAEQSSTNQKVSSNRPTILVDSLVIRISSYRTDLASERQRPLSDEGRHSTRSDDASFSESAISAIESAANRAAEASQKHAIVDRLANSLQRLATTLRNLSSS